MINRLCPKGMEQMKIGDICEILRGKRLTKKELYDDAQYKVFHGGLSPIGYYAKTNRPAQTVMVINVGASAGTVGFCDEAFWSSDGCFCLSHNDDVALPKFLYYYLAAHQLSIQSRVRKAGIPTLDASAVKEIRIALPPLEIQNRIVEVLDKMTTLTAELEAELEARKQQYEYYRNKLLTFNEVGGGIRQEKKDLCPNGVKFVKLGDCLEYEQPTNYQVSSKDYLDNGTPVLTAGQTFILGYTDETNGIYHASKEQPVIIFDDFTTSFHWVDFDFKVKSSAMKILTPCNEEANFRFIYYAMKCIKYETLEHSRQWISTYSQFEIPLPPLEEQARIVSILDRFEALTTDLQSGLPAEIEARRQQYEYYRNKLLTFEQSA